MFKLQRLEITGFKSFADHTDIVLTGEGITAVVGPNGCGKSNVADAIAWVLGEQRVKHLRGAEMKDVIFQGSRNRMPGGMAEVILHLVRDETIETETEIEDIDSSLENIDDRNISKEDEFAVLTDQPASNDSTATADAGASVSNAELPAGEGPLPHLTEPPQTKITGRRHWRPRRMALEFAPGEAISVTRRLYRSGESEYLLNGRACRLRDIQDLFSGTGLSGGHYAIIEQGRIGQILSAKPMERRTIIEEAAGITKFRVRQRAAEARLESARANLSRISDIVSEIERQVVSLRRQAAKSRRYQVTREELRGTLRSVFIEEERALSSLLAETDTQLLNCAEEESSLAQALSAREEEARIATQEARALEDRLSEVRAFQAEAALHRDRLARERVYKQEQLDAFSERSSDLRAEIAALSNRLSIVDAECLGLREADARLRLESEQSSLSLAEAEARYSHKLEELSRAEASIESSRADLLTHTAVAERLMEIGRQLDSALERLEVQAEGLLHEGERASAVHSERLAEAERLKAILNHSRKRLAELSAERESAVDAVVAGHERVSETDAEYARIRDELSKTRHRLDTLTELDARRAHYSPAIQRLFASREAVDEFHFLGTLVDHLHVEPQWERAVEGVLSSNLQSVLVPTPDDASLAAAWLRNHDGGRASFLVVGMHGASDESARPALELRRESSTLQQITEDLADLRVSDLLGASKELLTVLRRTLPEKVNARLSTTLEQAFARSLNDGGMYVTVEGDWVAGGQLVTAGNEKSLEEGAGLLGFKRELLELEALARDFDGELAVAAQVVAEARADLTELEDTVVSLNEVIGREERDRMTQELTTTAFTSEIERAERHINVVKDDTARLSEERSSLEERRRLAFSEAASAEAARTEALQSVATAGTLLAEARRKSEAENDNLSGQRASAAAAAERLRATAADLRRMELENSELRANLDRQQREVEELTGKAGELGRSILEIESTTSGIEEERVKEESEVARLAATLSDARARADSHSSDLVDLNRRAAAAREDRAALEVGRAEAAARLGYVRETCQTELNQRLEELSQSGTEPQVEDFELEEGRLRVEELRARLENFGAVNMMALEELGEAEERLQFLTTQRQDIIGGLASTEEALREIKRRSRERFRNAFEQINRNFGELFLELFGGGHGEMTLIDMDDVLESGIDIIAQPPGKRLQNVLLLSGGEKAMAALALVLGIFRYRPAPFCLLDEVDAPLDEANIGRFTSKIVQMAERTQFIVITHSKRTMEMARALYGVTMEEPGISKLVSVKF